ncbi:amino acid ABC transporter ATP-binding protein [Actinotalea sp. M2MS4P-6]|uniref:amino acid ABC transporter ATP-binding protein n=1 Tax=Actinotalea sp. M2MS4P-6 TaxID=2983762 RepID=UPI0021E3BB2D|nr:amino acid ABC transporter ATP-binding protein [Actinotalea sp. M2MS4P-6]MCV2394375.1 amino acid ABC transporter ATP-binding protein [Actinotalea sp. M2MS4P-6]
MTATHDRHAVHIRDVAASYGPTRVLDGVSLDVPAGTVTVLLGPSGSGKSTLLRTINRLVPVEHGTIWLGDELIGHRRMTDGRFHELTDRELCRQRRHIGMVFQDFNLFPHMTALENVVRAQVVVAKKSRSAAVERGRELLARVGLEDKAAAYPAQLSGGQQQRVAIARALAMDPSLVLFDEPTSALDPELVGEVLTVMRDLADEGETTMIVVTHEIGFARDVADQVVFMEAGRIVAAGSVDEILGSGASERVQAFVAGGAR